MNTKVFQLYLDKKYVESMSLLDELLKYDDENANLFRIKAYIYDDDKKFELAQINYDLAVKYSMDNAGFYLSRASFYFKRGLFLDAIENYSYIIENKILYRDISLDTAYFERSLAYCCIGKFDNILEDFNKYQVYMNFTYMKPINCKVSKEILLEYANNKIKLPF